MVWIDASGCGDAARLLREARGGESLSELLGDGGRSCGGTERNGGSLGAEGRRCLWEMTEEREVVK